MATKSHAVAGLDADNGVIRWRHVFERDSIGHVWDLHVSSKSKYCVSVSGNEVKIRNIKYKKVSVFSVGVKNSVFTF